MYRIDFSFLMYFDRTYTHLTFLLEIFSPKQPLNRRPQPTDPPHPKPPPYQYVTTPHQNQPPSTAPFRTSKPNHKHELPKNHHQNV